MTSVSSQPPLELRRRFESARIVVAEAAEMAMRMRPPSGGPVATQKGAQDWLTEADGAVEAMIAARIGALFPDDGFQGEETGRTRDGAFHWVVDPIDGTSNYARGRNRWCVSLGLLEHDQPVAGILAAPALGETYAAVRGMGATLNDLPIQASPVVDPGRAMIEVGWGPRVPVPEFIATIDRVMTLGAMPRSSGSGALALADVACGRLDGYIELSIHLWDVAAALAILAETTAMVSPFLRDGGLERGIPILAVAPGIAAALAEAARIPLD
ncbi:inositol monophosphatase [Lichenicola cladoniae]|uniref:Inositol monophosphatase n=1 Tax=Lichenicola cladoniae TaxID=1484109 RepID=A0A6M8HSZ9_9PROT|nr:inositol monophosphatase [Lichenicola cladoniae]NPD65560.1 inositol monophosphatase [Acetobacteraceae bacterium]QKE91396.1 inositol monophosphatase [Lichenicola cladoniae]